MAEKEARRGRGTPAREGSEKSGESGIRTHGDISATLDFESSALDQLSHLSRSAMQGVAHCAGALCREAEGMSR